MLNVAPVVYWTRYMLICTVFSRPQLNAILGKMVKEAEQEHGRTLSVNPTANRCGPKGLGGRGGRLGGRRRVELTADCVPSAAVAAVCTAATGVGACRPAAGANC